MSNHKSVARNQGYTRGAIPHIEKHNERKNTNYSNIDVVLTQSQNNIHFKKCDSSYLSVFDKMVQEGEISTRGLKLNNEGSKKESSIIAELVFDINTEYFETEYKNHGYTSSYDFAKAFYAEAYKMAVTDVGDEKYILSATMHADERNKGLSEQLGYDVYHYHLHVVYIPIVQKEIKWTKKCKDKFLVGKVKEVINQVNHSKKWESKKELGSDGKEHLVYSYSKLQDRYHDHMKAAGFKNFERGKMGSTAEHLSVLDYKTKVRQEELTKKESELSLINLELEDIQSELEVVQNDTNSLKQVKGELEKEAESIKELQKLKTKTISITVQDKPVFGSNVKISYENLLKLKEMADAYIANEKEIKNIRKRHIAVSKRETAATEKDKILTAREKNIEGKERLLNSAASIKSERDNLQIQLAESQNQIVASINENNFVTVKLQEAYNAVASIIQAVGTLKYTTEKYQEYVLENLTPKQLALLTAIENFGIRFAEKNNFIEQADNMKKYINIDDSIKKELKILEPKSRSNREYER